MDGDEVKVAVFNRYWSTFGGGETHAGGIADALSDHHDVTLLGPDEPDFEALRSRLGLSLHNVAFRRVPAYEHNESAASADYDLFINGCYASSAVSRARYSIYSVMFPMTEASMRISRRNRLADRLPAWAGDRLAAEQVIDSSFIRSYTKVAAISAYTKRWTERRWGRCDLVLPPPVGLLTPAAERVPVIAAVGRFFSPGYGHCKRQLELVEAFRALRSHAEAAGWRLVLMGGCSPEHREYASAVRAAARGLPVEVRLAAPRPFLERTLSEATLFWHAAGFGDDLERHPDRAEHFGLSPIEAMSAGAVPLVFAGGGPLDVVEHRQSGLHWRQLAELVDESIALIRDPARLAALRTGAIERAQQYDRAHFAERVLAAVDSATGAQHV